VNFGKEIKNTWKVLNVVLEGMEEISWTDNVKTKYYIKYSRRGIFYIQLRKEGRLIGMIASCVGTDC
jgi:hypothetical protein